jgi:hypothetical protein
MFERIKLGAAVGAAAFLAGHCAVSAATVYPEKGAVLVNEGQGYARIAAETPVHPGTQVMVKKGGSAMIAYGGGCTVHVDPGQVKVVRETDPCEVTGSYKDGPDGVEVASTAGLLVPGAVVAAAVAVGVAEQGEDKPASP